MLRDVGIGELEAHGRPQAVLRRPPAIAIPIDSIPKDLAERARTLRNDVKVWANGWVMWRVADGAYLDDLYRRLRADERDVPPAA